MMKVIKTLLSYNLGGCILLGFILMPFSLQTLCSTYVQLPGLTPQIHLK